MHVYCGICMHAPLHTHSHAHTDVLFIIFSLVNVIYIKISAAAVNVWLCVRVKYFASFEILKFNF